MPQILNQPHDVITNVNGKAEFLVLVKRSIHPVSISYFINKRPLKIDNTKCVSYFSENDYSYTLQINDLTPDEAGVLTFNVNNLFGVSSVSANLIILSMKFYSRDFSF